MDQTVCLLCGAACSIQEQPCLGGEFYRTPLYACPNCGRYVTGDWERVDLRKGGDDRRFRLACLLREQRLKRVEGIFGLFPADFKPMERSVERHLSRWWRIDDLLREFPKANDIIDRALLNLSRQTKHPWDCITPRNDDLPFVLFCPEENLQTEIAYMLKLDLIEDAGCTMEEYRWTITPRGWARLQDLSNVGAESRQAFVAMWFHSSTDKFFEEGFKLGIADAGFESKIIKNVEHNNKICDEIVGEIRKSRFIVADFTAGTCGKCESCDIAKDCPERVRPRGGVYFEAGFAMGLHLPVIWTVRKDQIDQVHFDTRQYNHIVYDTPEELRQKLRNRIAATIR